MTQLLETGALEVDGLELRYHASGSGPDVVLLHGFPETLQCWFGVAPLLAAAYRVHAFDWPGFGASARPWPWDYSAGRYATLLGGLVNRIGAQRPHLVATDIGMLPALLYALDRPEGVGKVVVMDGQPFHRPRLLSWELRAMKMPGLGEGMARLIPKRATWWGLRRGFAGQVTAPREVRREFYAQAGNAVTQKAGLRYFRSFRPHHERFESKAAEFARPLLVVWGERDVFIRAGMGEELAARVPGSRFELVRGAGHFVHMERPEAVSEFVRDFLTA